MVRHVRCEVAGDGNCLFTSLSIALASINYHYTAEQLRRCVASRVLNVHDTEMQHVLNMWSDISRMEDPDPVVVAGVAHVYHLRHLPFQRWSKTEREQVFKRMMSPLFYWGDEIAVKTLEHGFQVRILVWDSDAGIALQPVSHKEHFIDKDTGRPVQTEVYIFLELKHNSGNSSGAHYNLLGCQEADDQLHYKYIFREDEIPPLFRRIFAQFL